MGMVSKFIIAAYMSILGTDNVHIWTNKFENLNKCDLHKTRYLMIYSHSLKMSTT